MKKLTNQFISVLKKLDWKYTSIALGLLLTSGYVYLNNDECYSYVRRLFDLDDLDLFAGGIATIFMLTSKIKNGEIKFTGTMSFPEFRIPFEGILSFIGNPVTIYFTVSLMKGAFIYPKDYFPKFENIALGFIQLVTSYLMYISFMETWKNIKETGLSKRVNKGPIQPSETTTDKKVPDPITSDQVQNNH